MATTVARAGAHERRHEPRVRDKRAVVEGPAILPEHRALLDLQQRAGNRATSKLVRGGFLGAGRPFVQRKCASCANGSDTCADCEQGKRLQKKSDGGARNVPSTFSSAVHDGLSSQKQPLDPFTRTLMESHFGEDFGQIRVHTDARAGESAEQLSARAYTLGSDVVFGTGRYQPHTQEGQRLLAHELTHTIQQSNRVAYDHIGMTEPTDVSEQEADAVADAFAHGQPISQRPASANLRVARQAAPGATQPGSQPASQPAGSQPATAPGWTGCTNIHVKDLPGELSDAVSWVQEAIADLEAKELPRHTSNALGRYLTTDSSDLKTKILPTLKVMLAELKRGPTNFRCHTQEQCTQETSVSNALAYAGNPITICDDYFDQGQLDRVTALIHEAGHNAGLIGDIYEWRWPFPGLDNKTRLTNADSFAAFVRSNQYPSVAILEHPIGLSVGMGGLFPRGGASARYVVTGEYDVQFKQRVFRFLDLRAGYRIDVDSAGSVLNTLYVGARSFAPLSLTKTPVYLDLRAGGVFGSIEAGGPQFQSAADKLGGNVRGLSTDVGLGVSSGRFGASVHYTHIFNFLKSNPDIDELVVGGEIRFP
jgi:hypothetical protein